jgi:hypothetical protein
LRLEAARYPVRQVYPVPMRPLIALSIALLLTVTRAPSRSRRQAVRFPLSTVSVKRPPARPRSAWRCSVPLALALGLVLVGLVLVPVGLRLPGLSIEAHGAVAEPQSVSIEVNAAPASAPEPSTGPAPIQSDMAGLVAQRRSEQLAADAIPPASQILQPAEGSHVREGQPLDVAVAAEDAEGRVSEVEVSLDGGQTWQAAQPDSAVSPRIWHLKAGGPSAGAYRLLARAVDQAGNVGPALRAVSLAVDASESFTIRNPYAVPGTFRAAQLHDHTANSFDADKRFSPDVKSWYFKNAGYSIVIYTDHEKISQSGAYSDAAFQAFPGFESTGDSGHVSGWFVRQVVDFRLPVQQRIDGIRQAGGIACLNHPDWVTGYTAQALEQLTGYRAMEIYNWLTTRSEAMLRDDLEKWRQVLNMKGPQDPVWGVATGDAHGPYFNTGWTMLKVTDLSEASVRAAIENGAMYATNGPDFDTIDTGGGSIQVVAKNVRFLRFLDDTGAMVLDVESSSAEYRPDPQERWVRIEASDGAGHTAWSEPLWLLPSQPKLTRAEASPRT